MGDRLDIRCRIKLLGNIDNFGYKIIIYILFLTLNINLHWNFLFIRKFFIWFIYFLNLNFFLSFMRHKHFIFPNFFNSFRIIFMIFSAILFSNRLCLKTLSFYVQDIWVIWTIKFIMSELRFIFTIVVTISNFVKVIHV